MSVDSALAVTGPWTLTGDTSGEPGLPSAQVAFACPGNLLRDAQAQVARTACSEGSVPQRYSASLTRNHTAVVGSFALPLGYLSSTWPSPSPSPWWAGVLSVSPGPPRPPILQESCPSRLCARVRAVALARARARYLLLLATKHR